MLASKRTPFFQARKVMEGILRASVRRAIEVSRLGLDKLLELLEGPGVAAADILQIMVLIAVESADGQSFFGSLQLASCEIQ